MENILTIAEIKRRGMAAIESGLRHGPVHIYKRNRPAAVVLSNAEYQRLIAAEGAAVPGLSALEWLLAQPARGSLDRQAIDRRVQDERAW